MCVKSAGPTRLALRAAKSDWNDPGGRIMGLRTAAEVQRYGGAVQYRASSGTGRSGVSARFWQGFGHRTGPKGSGTAVGFIWADSWVLATILDPFRIILVILGPTPYLRLQHLSCLNSRHLSCLSSRHLSCLNSRHLSCLNRRHLSCLNRRWNSCRPPAGCCYVFC